MSTADDARSQHRDVVRQGFDRCAERYARLRGEEVPPELDWLTGSLAPGARVLDLGCGPGRPVTAHLAARGCDVTGIDLSAAQVELARQSVPAAAFVVGDVMEQEFPARSFAAATAFYMLFHLSIEEQPAMLARVFRWLVPGGLFLLTVTETARRPHVEEYLGAPMYWNYADRASYEAMAAQAGFTMLRRGVVGHGYRPAYDGPAETYPILVLEKPV